MEKLPLETFTENLLPKYRGYYISESGDVYSRLNRHGLNKLEFFWTKKKSCLNKAGYYVTMMVGSDGRQRSTPIHHLVALAYIGERPKELYVCHNDGNPQNNHFSNLRYDTPKSNNEDKEKHGTMPKGEKLPCSVIKESQIIDIFNMAITGMKIKSIAKIYNVAPPTIAEIIKRKHWKHVEVDEKLVKHAQNHIASGLTLCDKDIVEIFELRSQKTPKKTIAKAFDISEKIIRDILQRKSMAFVEVDASLVLIAQIHANGFRRPT